MYKMIRNWNILVAYPPLKEMNHENSAGLPSDWAKKNYFKFTMNHKPKNDSGSKVTLKQL